MTVSIHNRTIEEWYKETNICREEIQRLRVERNSLCLALFELCDLKSIKDKNGKTDDYKRRQPVAWETAFSLLDYLKDDNKTQIK